ncbi:MAG: leucyl aminopeptidase family protein [Pseudomonadota bacterium]
MAHAFAAPTDAAIPIVPVSSEGLDALLEGCPPQHAAWAKAQGFTAKAGATLCLPATDGAIEQVFLGTGSGRWDRFALGQAIAQLPEGTYALGPGLEPDQLDETALGYLLDGYRFERYKPNPGPKARLIAPDGVDAERLLVLAEGASFACELINTPANDMGPDALEASFRALGDQFGAAVQVVEGEDLLTQNFPLIHTVGRAAAQSPRLLDLVWGDENAPKITVVGKGVCFDTGGLNLKPGGSMGLMKKDMGGAANAMALAQMIMAAGLPIRLRLLVPAVENAVSGNAFRPQDVLTSRKGLTVEINNTDAEGRLVLADALALSDEEAPELTITLATLTGAARVALGPDLPPYFCDDDAVCAELDAATALARDPLWRMPFWEPYEKMIEPDIADIDNAPKGGFAGAITAALFLRRFVEQAGAYIHIDLYGWTPSSLPGRRKGGACQGPRALFALLEARYGRG